MKRSIIISLLFLILFNIPGFSQSADRERYGKTLNIGAGIGYYGFIGRPLPVIGLNIEFDVARNFTLAPFAGFYSYRNDYYWGSYDRPFGNYSYRETVIPVGLKGSYYFDELFRAGTPWDFYAGASIGFSFTSVVWDTDYYGDKTVTRDPRPLFLDAHIGAEYRFSERVGVFLDLSSGVSTIGLGFHF